MKSIKKWMIPVIILLSLMLTACGSNQKNSKQANSKETSKKTEESAALFGNFETKTLQGEAVNQDIFSKADLTMVNIWGTFCGPCISEMPELGELGREYDASKVQIVGIMSDVQEPEDEKALEIVEETKADYTHLVLSPNLEQGYISNVRAVPTTVFVDREGKQVGAAYAGARSKEQWEKLITATQEMME